MRSIQETELVGRLRVEADELKECFTRFSFQAIAFSALVFSLLGKKDTPDSAVAVASAFVVTMLLAVARIGTYKYGNANVVLGYELHLERTLNLTDTKDGWKSYMRSIGWEEARRAWRIIQPTIFQSLYYYHPLMPNLLRWHHRKTDLQYRWFEPSTLVATAKTGASYHPGGYLRLMLTMLHVLAALATLPSWIKGFQHLSTKPIIGCIYLLLSTGLLVFVLFRALQDYPRLWLLEDGLLSIHSCAVMWQAVVLGHYRSLDKIKQGQGVGYEHYTKNLAIQAGSLRTSVFRIDEWMGY